MMQHKKYFTDFIIIIIPDYFCFHFLVIRVEMARESGRMTSYIDVELNLGKLFLGKVQKV